MGAVGPGEEELEEALELLGVNAVLLQVGQAGVVALRWVAAASPVTAGQVLRLKGHTHDGKWFKVGILDFFFFHRLKKDLSCQNIPRLKGPNLEEDKELLQLVDAEGRLCYNSSDLEMSKH